jgi:NADH-quinone oxidoreductase subunit E
MRIQRIPPHPQPTSYQDVNLDLIKNTVDRYKEKKGALIALLQEVQSVYTYLPKAALELIQTELNYTISELYAVATFYAQFKLAPAGKHSVKVCKGTACHVQNADEVMREISAFLNVKDGETTPDGKFTLESVSCLGCCSLAPAMMIGEETFGKLTGASAVNTVKNFESHE